MEEVLYRTIGMLVLFDAGEDAGLKAGFGHLLGARSPCWVPC